MKIEINSLIGDHSCLIASRYGKGKDVKLLSVTTICEGGVSFHEYRILDHGVVKYETVSIIKAVNEYNDRIED